MTARQPDSELILAGDVGGTNARFGLFALQSGRLATLDTASWPTASFADLDTALEQYLAHAEAQLGRAGVRPARGCVALAGPVRGGRFRLSNADWEVDPDALRDTLGLASLELINDFAAVAHAIDWLEPSDLVVLQAGRPEPGGVRAILGAGTGLGTAFAVGGPGGHRLVASEGGHADFAPPTAREQALLEDLRADFAHVSVERVLSGAGLARVYRWLTRSGFAAESPVVAERMGREDPAAVVGELGLAGSDALCTEALDVFATVYGAQAGNLALTALPRGGVYVAGGIAPRILPKLRDGTFMRAFGAKGRLAPLLEEIPVYVIARRDAGLLGAAATACAARA